MERPHHRFNPPVQSFLCELHYLVSLSITLTLTLQVLRYVIFNMGYYIIRPISLPLISYGKIASITNLFLIGIMLSVFRTGDIVKDKHL